SKITRELESAHVVFTVGGEKFARKAVKQGRSWVCESKFLSDKEFDVAIEAWVTPGPDFEPGRQVVTQRSLRARERREVKLTFQPVNKWRKLTWAAEAAAQTPAKLVDVTEREKGEPLVLPPWTWEVQGDEWEVPAPHAASDGTFRQHIDLTKAEADVLGTKE